MENEIRDFFEALERARARARTTDPLTSHQAVERLAVRNSQAKVYILLRKWGPCIDEQLLAAAKKSGVRMSESGIRSRRAELVDLGLAEDTGEGSLTHLGNMSTIWRAVELAEWERRQTKELRQARLFG